MIVIHYEFQQQRARTYLYVNLEPPSDTELTTREAEPENTAAEGPDVLVWLA